MLLPLTLVLPVVSAPVAPMRISIDAAKPGVAVPRELFGVFFEEINQAGEGGVYAELLRNRGFEGETPKGSPLPEGWRILGDSGSDGSSATSVAMVTDDPLNPARLRSIRIRRAGTPISVVNDGFWGVPVQKGGRYALTMWVKSDTRMSVDLTNGSSASFPSTDGRWRRFGANLSGLNDDSASNLVISPVSDGTLQIAYASLMPERTYKGRENGLRPDLAARVAAMEPGFFRFPGGCYIEGNSLTTNAWDWKATLGAPETRPGTGRTYWGYPSGNGLGFHEYLQFCEDVGARAMYVANCGLSHSDMATLDGTGPNSMARYVRDALDAIEYANGPVTSTWGALRAKAGHPKPFGLKYLEIGNEAGYSWSFGGPAAYAPRFRQMQSAIRTKHPEIVTIANNAIADGGAQDYDLLSEHYYESPAWFWRNAARYDRYDRKGAKIYVGEYAVTKGSGRGNLAGALGEAAFMTGMERNADVVRMASYAPLLENAAARQWNPNAIVFDNHRSYGTPSYWVQTMFAQNRIARVTSSTVVAPPRATPAKPENFGLTTWKTQAEFKDVDVRMESESVSVKGQPTITGDWTFKDGLYTQTDSGENRQYVFSNRTYTGISRATMTLKARKLGGQEGFILLFGGANDSDRIQWNLGGWNNTRHAFQVAGETQPGSIENLSDDQRIETGRWYDLRLEREGNTVRGYVDGKLLQEMTIAPAPDFATIAGRAANGDLIVRIVNGASVAREAEITVDGFRARRGTALVLTGRPEDENSFETPDRVAPRSFPLKGVGASLRYAAPPHSLSVLRLRK